MPKVARFAVAGVAPCKEMIEVVYSNRSNRPSKRDLEEIVQHAVTHQFELYMQWQAVVDVKTPGPKGR